MLDIDKTTYKIDGKNFIQSRVKKTQILLGASLRKDSNRIKHLLHKDFGHSKKFPTFTITREGVVYQHFEPIHYSDYIGNKTIDRQSISIEFENMGQISFDHGKECFVNWINEVCPDELIFDKLWNNNRYWEKFTIPQIENAALLIDQLMTEFKINRDGFGHNVYVDNAPSMNGIVCRHNLDTDYGDLSPAFDFKKLFKLLNISIT